MKAIQLSIASLLLATSALGQALPDDTELSERIAQSLPAYWDVAGFRLVAQTDLGDAANPRSLIRFEADAVPANPLFTQVDTLDPFAIVVPTQSDDEPRILYGVMDLSYRAGEWSGDIEIENPVDELGQPADLFSSPTLIMGEPEAEARIAQFRAQREVNLAAQLDRALTALRNDHATALRQLEADQQTELDAARRDHDTRLARLRAEDREARDAAAAEHEAAMRRLVQDHRDAQAELRRTYAETLAELEAEQAERERALELRIADLRAEQSEELAALTEPHEGAMLDARNSQDEAHAALDAEQAEMEEGLEKRVAELAALTEAHEAAMRAARQSHAGELAALEREMQAERLELTETLKPELQEARQRHTQAIAALNIANEAELRDIRVSQARERGELRERLNAEVFAAQAEMEAEVERLQAQLGQSEDAQRLQAALLESERARSDAALEIRQALETAMARRTSIVEELPRHLRGGVTCRDAQGQMLRSFQLALQFNEANPSGLTGRVGWNRVDNLHAGGGTRGNANLVIRNPELMPPLEARLSLSGADDYSHLPSTIDLTISESFVYTGSETVTWTIDNAPTEVTCHFELA